MSSFTKISLTNLDTFSRLVITDRQTDTNLPYQRDVSRLNVHYPEQEPDQVWYLFWCGSTTPPPPRWWSCGRLRSWGRLRRHRHGRAQVNPIESCQKNNSVRAKDRHQFLGSSTNFNYRNFYCALHA